MRLLYTLVLSICFTSMDAQVTEQHGVEEFIQCTFNLSEVMLHDVVNPPAAARFYAYAMIGAYEAMNRSENKIATLTTLLKSPLKIDAPLQPHQLSGSFTACYTMLEVGKLLMPSGYLLEERQVNLIKLYRKKYKVSSKVVSDGVAFSQRLAMQIAAYAKTDGYTSLSTFPRYSANTKEEGRWFPTSPEYMSAVEPQWKTIRPFLLDSAKQFRCAPPTAFSKEKGSGFYDLMEEVYNISNSLSTEQRSIAAFWDCNPFAVTYSGHVAIGLKKISPGGHWIGITGIACREAKASLDKTILAHTLVALTLHDAFICCWNEKYITDRIRPESAINKYLDHAWRPLLQTPPFPEYTSGHSVVSTASAEILTELFGENFSFTDTSEEYFGIPARRFKSFRDAAAEAAISRLYGGIHFRDAIEAGQQQGESIGKHIIQKVKNCK